MIFAVSDNCAVHSVMCEGEWFVLHLCSIIKYSRCVSVDRDNDITDVIDHVFCVDHEAFGEHKEHELKPGGRDIPVSEDNKKEYVK